MAVKPISLVTVGVSNGKGMDNFTLGGPSRTASASGIVNSDWFVVRGGDGFQIEIDPRDPDIVYAEAQYGALVRFDRRTGERVGIKPFDEPGEEPLRWNWDSPLLLSPHAPTRLYFAANRLFRSEDRGDSWTAVSGELSRGIDPNTLPVMGKIWPPEAVAKGDGTSQYGNSTALAESPLEEGLLYVGTDDGVINVSEDGGGSWRRLESFPGVPEMTYVSRLLASSHTAERVYATFDNHKSGDFAPYVLLSEDRGRSWSARVEGLPENGPVLAIAEDPVDADLLFAGTEFGVFFSLDRGGKWVQLKGGIPIIAVRDLAIQAREQDLVAATFGRGFYVLDDFGPLRGLRAEALESEALLFAVRRAWRYLPARPLGGEGPSFQGASFYTAPNPPFGALITYYLKEPLETAKQKRKKAEKEAEGGSYPSLEDFRQEQEEEPPRVTLTVRDAADRIVRRLEGPTGKGIHRVNWDLRHAPARLESEGALAGPGRYSVSLSRTVGGVTQELAGPESFLVENLSTVPQPEQDELQRFRLEMERLLAAYRGAREAARELDRQLEDVRKALRETPGDVGELTEATRGLQDELKDLLIALEGDSVLRDYGRPAPMPLLSRAGRLAGELNGSTGPPTGTHRRQFQLLEGELPGLLDRLRRLREEEWRQLEERLVESDVPWTAGRLPRWP